MILAHRIKLDPTAAQAEYFARAAGTARFVWNWGLAEWDKRYRDGQKPRGSSLKLQFNAIKYAEYPWLQDMHRDSHSQPFADLQAAFGKFFAKKAKHPKFKKRGRHDAFYVANDKLRFDELVVALPKIGKVRLHEKLRFEGKICSARVTRRADGWYISVQVDVGEYRKPRTADKITGIDLGLKTFATLADGSKIAAPRPLRTTAKKLRRHSRQLSRKVQGSKNYQKARTKLALLHLRVSSIRNDFLHKLTTDLCKNHAKIVIEDLNVRGMQSRRSLGKALGDSAFGEFRHQLEYKSPIYETELVVANRWFASSKTCHDCGAVNKALTLADRTFICPCGYTSDRDLNAAKNLMDWERTGGLPGTHACGPEGSGSQRKLTAKPRRVEAGTKFAALR